MNEALVSIVMPVYNGDKYIREAIDSVLGQTYKNIELIIIDDGSTDKSNEIIRTYTDKRIRLVTHKKNKGVSSSRNEAIGLCKGKYIAMHDADDISLPERILTQTNYLHSHPDIGLLGTTIKVIDPSGTFLSYVDLLTHPEDLKLAEVFSNQFAQGSVMIRKNILKESGLYNPLLSHSEDTDLWRRISNNTKTANLKKPLYLYRLHDEGASRNLDKIHKAAMDSSHREFLRYLSHKSEYRFFAFHPFSMRGGVLIYLKRKSAVYRDMAWMYCHYGKRRQSIAPLLMAILHTPWSKKSYRQLLLTFTDRDSALALDYELF